MWIPDIGTIFMALGTLSVSRFQLQLESEHLQTFLKICPGHFILQTTLCVNMAWVHS